ncbi:MAG: amidase [Zhongshania sp.]
MIDFNLANNETELALFDQSIVIASQALGTLETQQYRAALATVQKAGLQDGVDKLLEQHNVPVLVTPSRVVVPRTDPINGDVSPNDWPGYGSHAARAGYPHGTVPMALIHGISGGLSFIGGKNTDAQIPSCAYGYEQNSLRLSAPRYLKNAEAIESVAKAMDRMSDSHQ